MAPAHQRPVAMTKTPNPEDEEERHTRNTRRAGIVASEDTHEREIPVTEGIGGEGHVHSVAGGGTKIPVAVKAIRPVHTEKVEKETSPGKGKLGKLKVSEMLEPVRKMEKKARAATEKHLWTTVLLLSLLFGLLFSAAMAPALLLAGKATSFAAGKVSHWVPEKIRHIPHQIFHPFQSASERAQMKGSEIASDVRDKAGHAVDTAQDHFWSKKGQAEDAISSGKGHVQDAVQDAKGRAEDKYHAVKGQAQDKYHAAKGHLQDTYHSAKGHVQGDYDDSLYNVWVPAGTVFDAVKNVAKEQKAKERAEQRRASIKEAGSALLHGNFGELPHKLREIIGTAPISDVDNGEAKSILQRVKDAIEGGESRVQNILS
jgi:hypothetical protein